MAFWDIWSSGDSAAAEQSRGDALDAQLAAMNTRDYGPGGRINQEIAASQGADVALKDSVAVQDHLASGKTGDVSASVDSEFWAGWNSGRDNVLSVPKFALKAIWKTIPWYLWVLLGLGLLFYTGIGQAIIRKSTK